MPEYDPTLPNQHASELFDRWHPEALPALYEWLSAKNIDANVMPHSAIAALIQHTEDDVSRAARVTVQGVDPSPEVTP